MRVLFVANFYPIPATPARGCFIQRQAHALVRRRVTVTVIHPVPHVVPGARLLTRRASHFAGLPRRYQDGPVTVLQPRYLTYPKHLVLGVPERFQYRAITRLGLEPPDIVHGHFAAPCGLAAMRLAADWRVPFVLSLRGYDTNFWPHINRFNRRRFVAACRAADALLANSHDLSEKARRLSGVEATVLPSGIDLCRYNDLPDRGSVRDALGVSRDRFVVLFVGNHIKAKGMDELFEVATRNEALLFVTAGIGPGRRRLSSLANTMCLGEQPNQRIAGLMVAADVCVLPSHSEGMPNVLLEAGACGLPVVATRVGGIPELIGDDERGMLVGAGDAAALESAILHVEENREQALERAARLGAHVREHFDVDRLAGRLAEIYEGLV